MSRIHFEPPLRIGTGALASRVRLLIAGVIFVTIASARLSCGDVKPIVYLEIGSQGTQLMHASGPAFLQNQAADAKLKFKRRGQPEFLSEHPAYFAVRGPGCLAFDGKNDQCHLLVDDTVTDRESAQKLKAKRNLVEGVFKAPGVQLSSSLEFPRQQRDWLIEPVDEPVRVLVRRAPDHAQLEFSLTNGLISRTFLVRDNLACISLRNLTNGAEYIRSIQPEARINLDGVWYDVGGLKGQILKSYLMRGWLPNLVDDGEGFRFAGIEIGLPKRRYVWQPRNHAGPRPWPPTGKRLTLRFEMSDTACPEHRGTVVNVHYEMYRGIPVMCKYLEFENTTDRPIDVDKIETEVLALQQDQLKRIQMESDYSHALFNREFRASDTQHLVGDKIHEFMSQGTTTKWRIEPGYRFFATHNQHEDKLLGFPHHNVMVSTIPMGPDETVPAGGLFTSMHSFELLHDSDDFERKSLAYRRMYRVIAPQVNENLLSAFMSSTEMERLKPYIDQASELGFECLSLQFPGVHIAHDRNDDDYTKRFRSIAEYAKSKGMILGAYELVVASRDRGVPHNVVHPITQKPGGFFGQSACVGSEWFSGYQQHTLEFLQETGFGMWDIDGPYHGEPCASLDHPGHKGLEDSQWQQWKIFRDWLAVLSERGQYLPIPEWNFLTGQHVTSMGYREAAAGLPANLQLLLYRQYIYDGTWFKTPTMGWIEFTVGKLKPYHDHLREYERWLVQGLGCGARINWRGRGQFWDTDDTKKMVTNWFRWFHRHRKILTSDMIHLARPSGRTIDAIFHVNSQLNERGLAILFNPLETAVTTDFELPLYYTGIRDQARISVHRGPTDDGASKVFQLDRAFRVRVPVEVPAHGQVWLLIQNGDQAAPAAAFVDRLRAGESQTIVTMGTSLTGGASKWVTPFAAWLTEEFGKRAKLINLGVGASASQRHLPGQSGLDVVRKVASIQPDVVFIEFGVNDAYVPYQISPEASKRNLNSIIDQILAANQNAEIILLTMNSVVDVPALGAKGATDRPHLAAYYQSYREVARSRNLPLVDLYSHWRALMHEAPKTFLKLVPDGVHPTQEGYQQVVMPALKRALQVSVEEKPR